MCSRQNSDVTNCLLGNSSSSSPNYVNLYSSGLNGRQSLQNHSIYGTSYNSISPPHQNSLQYKSNESIDSCRIFSPKLSPKFNNCKCAYSTCGSNSISSCSIRGGNAIGLISGSGTFISSKFNESSNYPSVLNTGGNSVGQSDAWYSLGGVTSKLIRNNNYNAKQKYPISKSEGIAMDDSEGGRPPMQKNTSSGFSGRISICGGKPVPANGASGESESRSLAVVARWSGTLSTRSTQRSTDEHDNACMYEGISPILPLFKGPEPTPPPHYRRLYDSQGPLMFHFPPLNGMQHTRAELRLWHNEAEKVISQNSSKRKVHRAYWLSPLDTTTSFPVAVKFVEDGNARDGRSIKREIECHLYIYQKLGQLMHEEDYQRLEDAWPCSEMFGYYLDKKQPGKSVLVTRKLSGPDFFDVIRTEHTSMFNIRNIPMYEYHKLQWCTLAMERITQYSKLLIRHNDIKPDNLVLDFYTTTNSNERHLDVKLIDLGTASMHNAKDFTGGTSWYESPEQKILEFYAKKQRNPDAAKKVEIGLQSDAWGAGLSITEVLMGRRVVDAMKTPHGPGALEYRGSHDRWAMEPDEWTQCARHALGIDREGQRFPLCAEAARLVFDLLVLPYPDDRAAVRDVTPKVQRIMEGASSAISRKYLSTFQGNLHSSNNEHSNGNSHNSSSSSTSMMFNSNALPQHMSYGIH